MSAAITRLHRPTAGSPIAIALLAGLAVGVLTSFLQAELESPWLALVNSASPWLTTAFVAGALQSRVRTAVWVGAAATLLQVVGYYATAELRGFSASSRYVALWSICALLGGPLFGAAGQSWRRADPAGIGAAALVAAYASEALVSYQLRLGYTSSAVLFAVIAVVLAVLLGSHRNQHLTMARWVGPAFLAGAAGHAALDLVA